MDCNFDTFIIYMVTVRKGERKSVAVAEIRGWISASIKAVFTQFVPESGGFHTQVSGGFGFIARLIVAVRNFFIS